MYIATLNDTSPWRFLGRLSVWQERADGDTFDAPSASPHSLLLTTKTTRVCATEISQCNHKLLQNYVDDGPWYVLLPFFRQFLHSFPHD